MPKMKLIQAIVHIPATAGLTSYIQRPILVTLISFLNDNPSNFLNAFL